VALRRPRPAQRQQALNPNNREIPRPRLTYVFGSEAFLALKRPAELLHVLRIHPGKEIRAECRARSDADHTGGPADAIAEQGCNGQGVRTAT
jgi:hypothetical protein